MKNTSEIYSHPKYKKKKKMNVDIFFLQNTELLPATMEGRPNYCFLTNPLGGSQTQQQEKTTDGREIV